MKGCVVAEFLADHPINGPEDVDFSFPDKEVLMVVEEVLTLYLMGPLTRKDLELGCC